MKVMQGIQVKLYPNKQQCIQLNQMFGNNRFLWNRMLDMLIKRHQNNPKLGLPTAYTLNYLLTVLKQEHPFLKISDSSSLQVTNTKLIESWLRFFKKPHHFGKPHFHSLRKAKPSYTGKSKLKIIQKHYLKIPKLGIVKVNGLNQLKNSDQIKQYSITLRPSGQYYLSLQFKRENQTLQKTNQNIGIDLGLHDLAITSAGQKYPRLNFKYLNKQIKHWQQKYNKRLHRVTQNVAIFNHQHDDYEVINNYDYTNWQRAKQRKASLQAKLANQRRDILQKITNSLVKRYDIIVIENLKVKNMLKNHHVANAISNHAWATFRQMLAYKCQWYGKQLVIVKPNNTSRICNYCHQKNHQFDKLSESQWLNIRNWTCPNCNKHLDRDINAANNILQRGLNQQSKNFQLARD